MHSFWWELNETENNILPSINFKSPDYFRILIFMEYQKYQGDNHEELELHSFKKDLDI